MRSRRVALAAWVVALALCLWQVAHTRFVADLSMFLPEAPTEEQRLLVDQLRDGALTRMMFIGIEGLEGVPEARAAVSRGMRRRLEASGEFVSVANGENVGYERERDLLFAHRYALSPNVTPERFSVEGLRAAIAETVDLLASPAGMLVKPLVARDPTAETLAVMEALRPEGSPPLSHGIWTSRDGRRAVLVARTRAAGSDTDAQARAVAAVDRAFSESVEEAVKAGRAGYATRLHVTGPAVFAVKSRALVREDVRRLALASLVLVAGILLAAYRSPLALALGLVPVACGALAGVAAVSLGFGVVHGITLGFGTALIGEAIDYSIYLFVQSETRDVGGGAWVAGFWPTIRLGVLTSIAGFLALLFSGLPGLAQLGLYSIVGLVAAALVTRLVLPVLLPARLALRDLTGAGERLSRGVRSLARARWLVAALCAGSAIVLVASHSRLFDHDLASLNPIPAWDRHVDAMLRADLGAADARVLVAVRAQDEQGALAAAERVHARLDGLVARRMLGGYDSPARFLPSLEAQRARQASLPPAHELRDRLERAQAGSPLPASRLKPFLEDADRARTAPTLTRAALAGTALGAALEGMLFADSGGRWTAIVALRPAEGAGIDVAEVREALAGSGALALDLKAEADRLYRGYFERALAASAIGLGVIVALLFTALRSPLRVLRVMAPLVAAVLVAAAFHALAGTRLDLLHLVGLLLVVAIGSNYALFFDRLASGASPARTLASLALANATTVASFGVLAISEIPVLRAIGSTVALGAFAALAFAAMLSRPGLVDPTTSRQLSRHEPKR
jgi:predicted exporter